MPGLSILIPVYNRYVAKLVGQLRAQLADWDGPVEICLLDDGSREEFRCVNQALGQLPAVRYAELPRNVGRATVRNRLAAAARHEWLLFLDNDGLLPDEQFVARYAARHTAAPVVVGGIGYSAVPPAPALRLRWHYARQREALPAAQRQALPPTRLMLNNVLIRATLMRQFPFDESLVLYGHEDTKLGWQLGQHRIPIHHFDNPVTHDGLEPAPIFLRKSRAAVRNLVRLFVQDGIGADSGLLRAAQRLRQAGLVGTYRWLFRQLYPRVRANLRSARPQLRYFDLLKLYWTLQELEDSAKKRSAT